MPASIMVASWRVKRTRSVSLTVQIFLQDLLATGLFSSAILTGSGVYIVDPIVLADDELRQLSEAAPIAGIVVTNANHARASSAYSDRFSVPIWANPRSFPDLKPARFTEAKEATPIAGELEVIEVEGAVAGEIALYHAPNGGTLIV